MEKLGDHSCGWIQFCPLQISVCRCKHSSCADPAETAKNLGQTSNSAARAPSAAVLYVAQPSRTTESGRAQGTRSPENAVCRGCQSTCKIKKKRIKKKKKKGQTSRWIFLPGHALQAAPDPSRVRSRWRVHKARTRELMGLGPQTAAARSSFPLVLAPKY